MQDTSKNANHWTLRLGAPVSFSIENDFDPNVINTDSDAIIARLLYSPLFQITDKGEYVPAAAASFEWTGRSYIFTFPAGQRTQDGTSIGAKDAYWSLLRMLKKNQNTHGDVWNFVCKPGLNGDSLSLQAVKDACQGIRLVGQQLEITPNDARTKAFLIPLLANIDFAVIPYNSVDWTSSNLKITNFRQTSGPYYLTRSSSNGNASFEMNASEASGYKYRPSEIQLIPVNEHTAIELLKSGDIDAITGNILSSPNELAGLSGIHIEKTAAFKLYEIVFTSAGKENFSSSQRLFAGQSMKTKITNFFKIPKENQTNQFFPAMSEGVLDKARQDQLHELLLNLPDQHFSKKVVLGVGPSQQALFQKIFKDLTFIEVRGYSTPPWILPVDQQPDCYFSYTDSAFYESLSLLNYNFSINAFGTKDEGNAWIHRYITEESKSKRLDLLRELHFHFLSEGYITPLYFSSYFAASNSNIILNQYKYYAGFRPWLIRRN